MTAPARPRVWLAGDGPGPEDRPTVRDTRMCTWCPGEDGCYHTIDGWHRATWADLHARFDLVEVT